MIKVVIFLGYLCACIAAGLIFSVLKSGNGELREIEDDVRDFGRGVIFLFVAVLIFAVLGVMWSCGGL